jgi:hypothetical protein
MKHARKIALGLVAMTASLGLGTSAQQPNSASR